MVGYRKTTEKQQALLDYIADTQRESGYPPSMKEIADHFGFKSITSVVDHLNALERKGLISRSTGARTINVKNRIDNSAGNNCATLVPIVGKVAAGEPILAAENIDDYLALDKSLTRYGNVFILVVKGDSMIDAHIEDGDMVIVAPQNDADINDIVVAVINDEATIKRYIPHKNHIELKPENKNMDPIIINRNSASIRIAGKVVGIFRKY